MKLEEKNKDLNLQIKQNEEKIATEKKYFEERIIELERQLETYEQKHDEQT